MQRYFSLSDDNILLSNGDLHHIFHVMRNKKGDHIEVIFQKKIYELEILGEKPFEYNVVDINSDSSELDHDITLFYCLSKGDKNEFVIQKATELGVRRIILLSSNRSVKKWSEDDFKKKIVRLNKIAKEASEQCHRLVIPEILGVFDIRNIPEEFLADLNLLAYENESGNTDTTFEILNKIDINQSISVLVGSEGGLEKEEVLLLNQRGFQNISLGKRILRTETATVYILSVIGFMLER